MPNREQRRNADKLSLGTWLHVEDAQGIPYDIYLKDISGKDEFDFLQQMQQMQVTGVGLCDLFLKGEVSLLTIGGLIWSARRKFEKKLTLREVLDTVTMACIETMELHDPEEEADEPEATSSNGQGPRGFGETTPSSSDAGSAPSLPASTPSTT